MKDQSGIVTKGLVVILLIKNRKIMKVIINGQIFDSKVTPIVLVWDTDKERQSTASHLESMDEEKRPRLYVSTPAGTDWSKALEDAKELYNEHMKSPIEATW